MIEAEPSTPDAMLVVAGFPGTSATSNDHWQNLRRAPHRGKKGLKILGQVWELPQRERGWEGNANFGHFKQRIGNRGSLRRHVAVVCGG